MDTAYLRLAVSQLEARGIRFESGLSDKEVRVAQEYFGFVFPPDLRAFLQFALPVAKAVVPSSNPLAFVLKNPSPPFINWRTPDEERARKRLDWPLEGLCFDIEHNKFWRKDWGIRPDSLDDAYAVAREAVAQAPVLIPIYQHRYIPDRPSVMGNPIFSVWQTDIIVYGGNLERYFFQEFGVPTSYPRPLEVQHVEFWSDLL